LSDYHLLPSVRADLLARLGRVDEARAELERALELTQNESERRLLSQRAAEL
jgi:predicted RNA polymerase sigma factor